MDSVCIVRGEASAAREDNRLTTTPKAENKNEALQHTLSFFQHLLKGTGSMRTGRVLHGQGGLHEQHLGKRTGVRTEQQWGTGRAAA